MFPNATKKVARTYSRQARRPLYDEDSPVKRRRVERAGGTATCSAILARTSPSTVLAPTSPVGCSSPARLSSARVSSSPPTSQPTSDEPTSDAPTSDEPTSDAPTSDAPTSDAPTSDAPTSDVPTRSSPPSSPALASSPPADARRRPVFSLFRRNLKHSVSAPAALSERSHDTHRSPPPPPPKKKRMVQMQLDLASQHRKACRTCGMEYIPSNAADVALHNKFHATNRGGVDCTKATAERLRQKQVWSGDGGFVAVVGRRDALPLRNKASEVLRVVNAELAAVPVADGELWSQTRADGAKDGTAVLNKCDRFKVYLYMRGQKCVAACLAESIREAFTVLAQGHVSGTASGDASGNTSGKASGAASGNASGTASGNASGTATGNTSGTASEQQPSQSSSISVSTAADTVLLGISRIWVSSQFRKQGLARRLLDVARGDFTYGLTVDKRLTAFSQPTESGGKLARSYFGCEAGWHVYMD